jgi:hypothetical protein
VAYDDDDDWPEPERDSEELRAASRRRIAETRQTRQRILRWTYAGLGILLVLVILLAILR